MKLSGKTALVTGGAVRVGAAICEVLSSNGCNVVIHCRRSVAAARGLATRIRAQGHKAWVVTGELSTEAGCRKVFAAAMRRAGGIDILINNAAVFERQSLHEMTGRALADIFAVNLFAPMLLTQEFARQGRPGAVVNLLDQRIAGCDMACVPYHLSKKALADFTTASALELAPGIAVNAVAPGPVLTSDKPSIAREKAGVLPMGKRPTVADLAEAVVFLLKADSITGQVIYVDGGQHSLWT